METFDNSEPQTAALPILTECQAEYCAFCGALDRMLSRKCFNCGWWPTFPEGNLNPDQARQRFHVISIRILLWWQHIKTWLHLYRR